MENSIDNFLLEKIRKHVQLDQNSAILCSSNVNDVLRQLKADSLDYVFNLEKTNNIRRINKFHKSINTQLNQGDIYISCLETLEQRRFRIQNKVFIGFKTIFRVLDFTYKRVIPKLPIFKQIYFNLTKGKNRVISKAEALGRLISCGFEILDFFEYKNLFYIVSKKNKEPEYNMKPSYGVLFKMKRIGYQGKMIYVYKIRTMHPYSEYCQELIMRENKLAKSGKILNDFRITTWGKFFRKFWFDELPMFINFFKGELTLVGVRPLSTSYFQKYPKKLQDLRIKTKPGLLPPYYADLPQSFDEILLSEEKYLEKKLKKPFVTDLKYFYLAVTNIVFKGARSK